MGYPKTCTCGARKKISCNKCSIVKMAIMLKNGNKHLKVKDANGKNVNPVWFSPFKKNNKSFLGNDTAIVTGMLKRFKKDPLCSVANVVMFYDNFTDQLIKKETL